MAWLTGPIQTLIAAGIGGIMFICLDRIFLFIIQTFYPATWLVDIAKDLNGKIEAIKKQYPEAGKKLEDDVVQSLNDAIKVISAD